MTGSSARSMSPPLMAALGIEPVQEKLYWQLLSTSRPTVSALAVASGTTPESLLEDLEPMVEAGVVTIKGSAVEVLPPAEALAQLVSHEAERAATLTERLNGLAVALPTFVSTSGPRGEGNLPLDGEIVGDDEGLTDFVAHMVEESTSEAIWLRPDQWRLPSDDRFADVVRRVLAQGRSSRAIHPTAAMLEAPEAIRRRARAGEQVRLLPEVPFRLVLTDGQMLVQSTDGVGSQHKVVVRQPVLLHLTRSLFEEMWRTATPLPAGELGRARPELQRLLLAELARGAKDEQIARSLGIGLRTVRRRVADLLTELGVDTRFQAGVEAVRRGWL